MKKNLVLLLTSRLVSLLGSGIQAIAIPLYVLAQTGSAGMMALFSIVSIVPVILVTLPAGIMGDRHNRKHIMLYTDALAALLLVVMAVLLHMDSLGVFVLLGLQALTGILDTFYGNASASIIPVLFGKDNLAKIHSKRAVVDNIAHIAGPILGGFLYAFGGIQLAFIANLISFVVSFLCELLLSYDWQPKHSQAQKRNASIGKEYAPVVSFVKNTTIVKRMFFLVSIMNLLAVPFEIIAIPYFFKQSVGVSDYEFGFIQSAMLVGALLGNLALPLLLGKGRDKTHFNVSLLAQHIFILALSVLSVPTFSSLYATHSISFLVLSLGLLIVIGLFNGIANTMLMASLQTKIPNEMMGKFIGLLQLVLNILNPIGIAIMGCLLDSCSVILPMMSTAVLLMGVVVWFIITSKDNIFAEQASTETKP